MAGPDDAEVQQAPDRAAVATPEIDTRQSLSLAGNPLVGEDNPVPPQIVAPPQDVVVAQGFPFVDLPDHDSMNTGVAPDPLADFERRKQELEAEFRKFAPPDSIKDPDKFFTDVLNTADALRDAPRDQMQAIFSAAINGHRDDGRNGQQFSTALNNALRKSTDNLIITGLNDVSVLRDTRAETLDNLNGIVAAEFTGDKDNPQARLNFEAAKKVIELGEGAARSFSADPANQKEFLLEFGGALNAMDNMRLFSPPSTMPAREKPDDALGIEAQVASARESIDSSFLKSADPDQVAADAVKFANLIAFATPDQMSPLTQNAVEAIMSSDPTMPVDHIRVLLEKALNTASGSTDFRSATTTDDSILVFQDQRLVDDANAGSGSFGALPINRSNPIQAAAFKTAVETLSAVQQMQSAAGIAVHMNTTWNETLIFIDRNGF